MMRLFERFGSALEWLCLTFGRYASMAGQLAQLAIRPPWHVRLIILQSEQVGVQSLPVVMLTALFTGMVLALQSYVAFHRFGAESMVSVVVSLSMVRELGPVLVGIMVAGRVGASFAAELGTMRVSEQIDALWTLSTHPLRYLVLPRVFAAIAMLPLLVVLADVIGIFGGYVISVMMLDQNPHLYLDKTTLYLTTHDFHSGIIKAAFFGGIIGLVGCAEGYYCSGGAQGVGETTTRAVVISCMSILVADYILTAWMFS